MVPGQYPEWTYLQPAVPAFSVQVDQLGLGTNLPEAN